MSHLFIRTEASPQIGMGHFMRCFAVAEAARERHIPVTFLLTQIEDSVATRCREIGAVAYALYHAYPPQQVAAIQRDDWILIDSYEADTSTIRYYQNAGHTAVIDDLNALESFDCDILINPAIAAPRDAYAAKSSARLLLGPDFALIRREFRQPASPLQSGPSIAVIFGGSDPTGLTANIATQLHDAFPGMLVKVIAGPANQRISELEALAQTSPDIHLYVSPASVARVLAGSQLVVTAAGGTIGEVAAMGLPALVLVVYDNQAAALQACPYPVIDARQAIPDDFADTVGALLADLDKRQSIASAAHKIVDGKGAQRVVEAMFFNV